MRNNLSKNVFSEICESLDNEILAFWQANWKEQIESESSQLAKIESINESESREKTAAAYFLAKLSRNAHSYTNALMIQLGCED